MIRPHQIPPKTHQHPLSPSYPQHGAFRSSLPPHPRHLPVAPPLPTQISHTSLSQSSISGQVVFRVWEATSASPLELVEGDIPRSGFSSPVSSFRKLSPTAYAAATHGMEHSDWAAGPIMREKMIQHLSGTARGNGGKSGSRQGEESPFVSVSRSLDWAIWDIARRLAERAQERASAAGKGEGEGDATEQARVHLSVVRVDPPKAHAHGGATELWINPTSLLTSWINQQGVYPRDRVEMCAARDSAKDAYEVLYYGRIFGTSVITDLVFTAESLPMFIPSKYFRPLAHIGNESPGWLTRLRWDPLVDAFKFAEKVILEGVYTLPTIWRSQPVLHLRSFWPANVVVDPSPLSDLAEGMLQRGGQRTRPQRLPDPISMAQYHRSHWHGQGQNPVVPHIQTIKGHAHVHTTREPSHYRPSLMDGTQPRTQTSSEMQHRSRDVRVLSPQNPLHHRHPTLTGRSPARYPLINATRAAARMPQTTGNLSFNPNLSGRSIPPHLLPLTRPPRATYPLYPDNYRPVDYYNTPKNVQSCVRSGGNLDLGADRFATAAWDPNISGFDRGQAQRHCLHLQQGGVMHPSNPNHSQCDFLGPEEIDMGSLAQAEAMLINLHLRS